MRKFYIISTLLFLSFLLIMPEGILAKGNGKNKGSKNTNIRKVTADPDNTILDINNITSWINSAGFMQPLVGGSWNGTFPKGTDGVIFQEGIVWGGQVHDGGSEIVRVGGNSYSNGTTSLSRIFRVRPDYATADLSDDASNFFMEPLSQVTTAQMDELRIQYAKDWKEWPANLGAPYQDVNNNGTYDSSIDIPGVTGASQTIWCTYDDRNSKDIYGSEPIGMKVTETLWGYAVTGPLSSVTFKKVDLIYTGTTSSLPNSTIDSMYITQWADPDVGNSTDDYAGSDTALNLGYAYNSTSTDIDFAALNLAVPAVGYDFLQGVSQFTGNSNDSALVNLQWRKGYKYVNAKPMSGFEYFAAGGTWQDPDLSVYDGSLQWYNLQRGSLPRPTYPTYTAFPANVVDYTPDGTFLVDGDPVQGSGKLDGSVDASGDRRIMVNNGPFTMKLNDTAEVVVALVGGEGSNNISSVAVLKYNDSFAQFAFDRLFNIPQIQKVDAKGIASDMQVVLDWGENSTRIDQLENQDHAGYGFEGYNVYQLPTASSSLSDAYLIATYDKVDLVKVIFDNVFDASTGYVINKPVMFGGDFGVKRAITITQDYLNGTPLRNGQSYYYAITAYAYSDAQGVAFHALESQPTIVSIMPHALDPGVTSPEIGTASNSLVKHSGTADASVNIQVVDPSKVTGHQYQVSFHNETFQLGADQVWKDITAASKRLSKVNDLSGSSITSAAAWSEKKGSVDLHYTVNLVSSNYDYCDGVEIKLPAGVVIDSAYQPISNSDGSNIAYTYDPTTNTLFYSVVNKDSLINGDSTNRTGAGVFAGGEDILIIAHNVNLPLVTSYHMYDDNWGATYVDSANGFPTGQLIDVAGSDTLSGPIASKIIVQHQWNVKDISTGLNVVQNQTIYNGVDLYAPQYYFASTGLYGPGGSTGNNNQNVGVPANVIFDGIQVAVNGSYVAPTTFGSVYLNGKKLSLSSGEYYNSNYIITDFIYFGYADGTAAGGSLGAYVNGGSGTTEISQLQQDYEVRFTGVLGDTVVNGAQIKITKSGGSYATLFGATGYKLANHPLNPNPGKNDPFLIRIPFEVWNIDKNEQVNLLIWDRSSNPANPGFEVWNTSNRNYTWVVNTKYSPTVINPASKIVSDSATWNWVFYKTNFTTGDVIKIIYNNPLQVGKDAFSFTIPKSQYSSALAKQDVAKINVFPNPYYGYQDRETSRAGKYVTFSHLPNRAVIRIFDLSGVLVKTINKNDNASQFITWNLQNDNNYPVASGIYVAYIDMPDLGTTKVLKLAILQEEQILNVY